MLKEDLIHILRAAHNIWTDCKMPEDTPICLIGSQSILLHFHDARLSGTLTASVEADLFLYGHGDVETADIINGAIGEHTAFHRQFGYYADGVSLSDIVLPEHWLERAQHELVNLESTDGTELEIVVIQPEDLIASKLLANRSKDREYIRSCKELGLLDGERLMKSIYDLPRPFEELSALTTRYEHIDAPLKVQPYPQDKSKTEREKSHLKTQKVEHAGPRSWKDVKGRVSNSETTPGGNIIRQPRR